jgi:hypothetical protein
MQKKQSIEAKKHIFTDKRAQSIGITIAKMPVVTKIAEALQIMDEKVLQRNHIAALLREYITDEELNELTSLDEPGVIWEKQEAFMLALSKVELVKLKLHIWNFTFDFVENYENVKVPVNHLKAVHLY